MAMRDFATNKYQSPLNDSNDVDFTYADTDSFEAEISELFSYTERFEFVIYHKSFDDLGNKMVWDEMDESCRGHLVLQLMDELESASSDTRLKSVQALLYIALGAYSESSTSESICEAIAHNSLLLNRLEVFEALFNTLRMEIKENGAASGKTLSLNDNLMLRNILSVMFVMLEVLRRRWPFEIDLDEARRTQLAEELVGSQPNEHSLVITLFEMCCRFCSNSCPNFPTRKILLVLWKTLLLTLGGSAEHLTLKNKMRQARGLAEITENVMDVCVHMRAATPPPLAAESLLGMTDGGKFLRDQDSDGGDGPDGDRRMSGNGLMEGGEEQSAGTPKSAKDFTGSFDRSRFRAPLHKTATVGSTDQPGSPRPGSPMPPAPLALRKALPWSPKVNAKDLEAFLDSVRRKFVGFSVPAQDTTSLIGLPPPICESVKVLKSHLYVSLSEVQIKREDEIGRYPLTKKETEVAQTPAEVLYESMLHSLPQYMIALLKIMLAASPNTKKQNDSVTILNDVLPEPMPTVVLESIVLGIDVNRHKEVIIKAISAILLLLLKHFKINHVYQFEFTCQHLVFANCIPLILKFLNQTTVSAPNYTSAKNELPVLNFPLMCVSPNASRPLDERYLEAATEQLPPHCWRNMFASINLLRILNKLCKWKHSRTMMLVVFKSAPMLRKILRVRQSMLQLYALKLLKMQTKYLGRQWRKNNMVTMSAIYQKVRHRLTDDWAFGNDIDARPWDYQTEECALRAAVDAFNHRRYTQTPWDPEYVSVDNDLVSVCSQPVELGDFEAHYSDWLEREVINTHINWDLLV